MESIKYSNFDHSDFDALIRMGQQLWPGFKRDELEQLMAEASQAEKYYILMAKNAAEEYAGFAIFSIRTDYVEGAEQSPTGYLEGIFVEPAFRKAGIAREFIRMGEVWCKAKGCTQLGSDTWLTDTQSRAFHKQMGFWEEEEVVHFLKNIE